MTAAGDARAPGSMSVRRGLYHSGPIRRLDLLATSRVGKPFSLRMRVALLAATVVAVAVAVLAAAAYGVVARALYAEVDTQLRNRVETMVAKQVPERLGVGALDTATLFSDDLSVVLLYPDGGASWMGPLVQYGEPEFRVHRGEADFSLRTVGGSRVLAQRTEGGTTIVLVQDLQPTREFLRRLSAVLFVVGGFGVILAAAAGTAVGRTGLRPVARLTAAAQRVARTDDLTPIPVTGDDELARLTEAFNVMLRALGDSRERQARLVADAGHELRTPLTSLRTNMELLVAASKPGAPTIPDADMDELRADIMAQIEELSTLVGDLVDLAREDAKEVVFEPVDLGEVLDRCVERVRRRRPDVDFAVTAQPWLVLGDFATLTRAVLNVLDNAAKWSPPGAVVAARIRQLDDSLAELTVDDRGPGVPPAERELVFDRFYRSTASRSMPGSGLGLSIVRQVVQRHGGDVTIGDSPSGGASVRVVLPGSRPGARAAAGPAEAAPVLRRNGAVAGATPARRLSQEN